MNRFNTSFGKMQLEEARKTASAGYEAIYNFDASELKAAKALPGGTSEEKEYKKAAVSQAKDFIYAKKSADKYFPNGIKEFDTGIFETLFDKEDKLAEELEATYKKLYAARDRKDKPAIDEYMKAVKKIRAEQKNVEAEIKKATNENSVYNRAAKPYINAKKLITQSDNYARFDEIAAMYEDAKLRHEQAMADAAAEIERKKAEEKAYAEKIRAEKTAKKSK